MLKWRYTCKNNQNCQRGSYRCNNKLYKQMCFFKHFFRWTWSCWNCASPKKQQKNEKTNYGAISFLPIISKFLEKILFEQLETVANKIFSVKSFGFRNGYFSKIAFLNLLRNCFSFCFFILISLPLQDLTFFKERA